METLGLTLAEGKLILKRIQENVIREQIQERALKTGGSRGRLQRRR